ncbi:MAG: hypothetical protein PVG03_10375 [Desulfarculaceae bacterium]|jgi:hypothetical protein
MSSKGKSKSKKLTAGLGMMVLFTAVLILMFLPVFGEGQNGLNYMDNLYNSISKASAYYIPQVRKEAGAFPDREVSLQITLPREGVAKRAVKLLETAGAQVQAEGCGVKAKGKLGEILASALTDADAMFHNQSGKVSQRYGGADARGMLFTWWHTLSAVQKSLNKQKLFAEAALADRVMKKAVETAYNYYGIQPEKIGDKWGIVLFSLIFYVVYTVWYGYAVMFLFEGAGFQLEAH